MAEWSKAPHSSSGPRRRRILQRGSDRISLITGRNRSLPLDPEQSRSQASLPGQAPADKIVTDFDEDDEANLEQLRGKGNVVAVNSGDTFSKKRQNSRKRKDFLSKIVADFDEDDEANIDQTGSKENVVAVNSGDTSSKKQRNSRKTKDFLHKIVADCDEDEANLGQTGGEENVVAVNSGDTSSKKQRNSRKTKDFLHKIVADFDEDGANLKHMGGEENVVAVNSGDTASKKRRNGRKRKDLVDGKVGGQALKKKSEPSKGVSDSDKIAADFDEGDDDEANLVQNVGKENIVDVNSADTSSKKQRTNNRKNKDLVDGEGREASRKKSESYMGSSILDKIVADFDEDDEDEENLEQNAARMLSSRFDPSCTGFPSKRKSSASQKANESSLSVSSTLDSFSQQVDSSGDLDAALDGDDNRADDQSRALRPRREDKGKGVPRRRRHFYEIPPRDLEPQWVLNRKIKVFWPLDESWYFGQVTDYHPECRLYHIKYDDRDEEWIDLNEEKFKLLLYPSEVPGRDKSKKVSRARKDVHQVETVSPEDGDNSLETDLDSEPIASWLARVFQRGKSLKSQGSETTDCLHNKVAEPKGMNDADWESTSANKLIANEVAKSLMGTSNTSRLVYARKRSQTSVEGYGAELTYGSASWSVNLVDPISVSLPASEKVDSENQLWLIDHQGRLWLNIKLVESRKVAFQICLPSLPYWEFPLQTVDSSLLHNILMVQHGVLLPVSSSVVLEMLLIDKYRGLNFFSFEGFKQQALTFVFEILIFFSEAGQHMDWDMQSPATSIRFRLFGVQDLRKHHVFELHSFSRLQSSEWVCLESKLLQHCHLLKQLSASECTYDNIKELEQQSLKQFKSHAGLQLSSHAGFDKESALGMWPSNVSREGRAARTSQSALYFSDKHGEVPPFVLFSSATPTFLLTQHLQLLMENSSATHHCQHDQSAESLPAAVISIPSQASDLGNESRFGHMIVDISSTDQVGVSLNGKESISKQASDVSRSVNEGIDQSPNTTGPQRSLQGDRNTSIPQSPNTTGPQRSLQGGRNNSIPTPGDRYPKWVEGTPKFMRRGFSSGPKKPRSQVQYALPGADYDFSVKQKTQNQRSVPGKRIRRDSPKRIVDASSGNHKKFDLLVCDANVLVTRGDRGWRECGALIVLEVAERNEWRLAVKLSGITKYSYKVNHILQPGSTNRYSHAVLWKGGKDWVLEFTDRSQWNLFKEMHEECYNRNVRAASVKNIPIPGVQLIDECDDYGAEAPFVRNPIKYLRQHQNDVEMAMDPSHVLYDVDSDDEQWLISTQQWSNENGFEEISEEFLEKTMDMFEKASYVKNLENFTEDELEGLVVGMGSVEAVKRVYEHWRKKRGQKGMPILRHLQPPLWEKYQRQLKEWENATAPGNSVTSASIQERVPIPEKPAMFAFCLKPRGLDVRNKSFKQRCHKKYPVSGHLHSGSADRDKFYIFGRRSNGHTYGGEKVLYRSSMHESPDISLLLPSMRLLSPRDAHYTLSAAVSIASPSPRAYMMTKRKKHGRHPSSASKQTPSYGQRKVGRKNGVQQRKMGLPNMSSSQMDFYPEGSERQGIENMDDTDHLNECRLREASAAAKYALEVAKFKREKAQILFEKADVAVQKAVLAIMTAEAIKASNESVNGGS